jgi:hypothetical protein
MGRNGQADNRRRSTPPDGLESDRCMHTYLLLPIHRPEADYWAKNERRQAEQRQKLAGHPYLESVLAGIHRPPWLESMICLASWQ